MSAAHEASVRRAAIADAREVARLLHDFNTEFSEPVPNVDVLAERVAEFIEREEAPASRTARADRPAR